MIKLIKVLGIDQNEADKYKIHFAIGDKANNRTEALDAFRNNAFKVFQESQTKQNFERENIISLIYYKEDKWLYAGVYKSNGCKKKNNIYIYNTKIQKIQEDLIGRLVVHYKKTFRQSYPFLETCMDNLIVGEILEKPAMVEEFPGYNNVKINYECLKTIINKQEPTWKSALSNMKGVYIIVDKSNGKKYVGSATGEERLWNRWSEYIKNGHGNNIVLKEIISRNGIDYAKNFQFSILEIAGMNIDEDLILQRESFWKEVLMTRVYGYNKN